MTIEDNLHIGDRNFKGEAAQVLFPKWGVDEKLQEIIIMSAVSKGCVKSLVIKVFILMGQL